VNITHLLAARHFLAPVRSNVRQSLLFSILNGTGWQDGSGDRGRALSHIPPRVGVVLDLAHRVTCRDYGIPMVLGVNEAAWRIPDRAGAAVEAVFGIVRQIR